MKSSSPISRTLLLVVIFAAFDTAQSNNTRGFVITKTEEADAVSPPFNRARALKKGKDPSETPKQKCRAKCLGLKQKINNEFLKTKETTQKTLKEYKALQVDETNCNKNYFKLSAAAKQREFTSDVCTSSRGSSSCASAVRRDLKEKKDYSSKGSKKCSKKCEDAAEDIDDKWSKYERKAAKSFAEYAKYKYEKDSNLCKDEFYELVACSGKPRCKKVE